MATEQSIYVRVTRRFRASAERVFDAWVDPAKFSQWMFSTPSGQVVRASMDARVGGTFTVVDRRAGQDVVHVGEYVELDRPRRLAFMFSVDGSEVSRVAIDIVPLDAGCELTLVHALDPKWAEYAGRTEQGWTTMLGLLAKALGES